MPLVATVVDLPADVVNVRAGDIDNDGSAELIAVTQSQSGRDPDQVTLTFVAITDSGPGASSALQLGNRPLYWEANGGLYGVDGQGLWSLDPSGGAPSAVVALITPLAGIGPATPRQAPLAHDLNGDGAPELFVFSGGRLHAFAQSGEPLGSVATPSRGGLGGGDGLQLSVSTGSREVVFADLDGDGLEDILLPAGDRADVHYTGDVIGERSRSVALPVDLEPRERGSLARGETSREVSDRWFQDFDGDGMADLGVLRTVMEGSWFGATSELLFCKGNGAGFEQPLSVAFESAAAEAYPLDTDDDGDLDLVIPQVDVGLGNIIQALTTKSVSLQVNVLEMNDGFAAEPTFLREVDFSIDPKSSFLVQYRLDFTGDGLPDLLMGEDGMLKLYAGSAEGIAKKASAEVAVTVPPQAELLVADLTGDGVAEAFLWGRLGRQGTLIQLR